ncbi:MAG: c-type cytochrome [Chitinophagales bacterium]
MRKLISIISLATLIYACGGQDSSKKENTSNQPATGEKPNPSYDPNRGAGKFAKVEIAATLDQNMAGSGQKVYDVKCSSCHKLTAEKLVGPGWSGVTSRHTAEWIMNFATNPDEMLDKDAKAQAMLEICLVRMPNQNLTDDDARHIYEFMRKNDGVK